MADATARGEIEGLHEGQTLTLYIKMSPEGRVADASFTNSGDRSADASCSVLTTMIPGKTVAELERIDILDIARRLDSDTPGVAAPAHDALRAAVAALKGEASPFAADGRLICHCFHVRDGRIRTAIREHGLASVEEVNRWTRACGGCRSCRPDIELIIDQEKDRKRAP